MENQNPKIKADVVFLRVSRSGKGVFFFTPNGKKIYSASRKRLMDLLTGGLKFVLFTGNPAQKTLPVKDPQENELDKEVEKEMEEEGNGEETN
jgi:hypothetical protein